MDPMTKLEQIEKSILELSPDELRAFTDWFEEMMEKSFDDAIERDRSAVPVRHPREPDDVGARTGHWTRGGTNAAGHSPVASMRMYATPGSPVFTLGRWPSRYCGSI